MKPPPGLTTPTALPSAVALFSAPRSFFFLGLGLSISLSLFISLALSILRSTCSPCSSPSLFSFTELHRKCFLKRLDDAAGVLSEREIPHEDEEGGTEREAQLKTLAIAAAQPRGQRYRQVAKRARVFVVFSAEEVCRIEDRARLPSRYPLQFFFDWAAKATTTVPELSSLSLPHGDDATGLHGRFLEKDDG